jgi:hypothetical protein
VASAGQPREVRERWLSGVGPLLLGLGLDDVEIFNQFTFFSFLFLNPNVTSDQKRWQLA